MRVIIEADDAAASQRAANIVAAQVRTKPRSVLGLATGSTPLQVYANLVRMHQEEGLDFSQVVTFNLDEYVGLSPTHPQSYRYFMQANLFNHINVLPSNTHVPDGRAFDYESYCQQYEKMIREAGGIDLQILGIGGDGHIAFNEPGSSLGSRTRLKSLTQETIDDNARFFDDPQEVPRLAVTMGVATILEARRCVLLAFGEAKAKAIAAMVEGPVSSQITASALQWHPDTLVVLDEAAASALERRDYYQQVEAAQRLLETGQFGRLGIQRGDI